jgi:transposase
VKGVVLIRPKYTFAYYKLPEVVNSNSISTLKKASPPSATLTVLYLKKLSELAKVFETSASHIYNGPMRIAKRSSEFGFTQYDVSRLTKALKRATDARLFQRVQAVLWVAQGDTVSEVAELTGVSGQTVYNWLQRSLACHQVAALADAPRSGRPVTAPQILQHLRCNPLYLGHRTTVWSVKLLAAHLSRQYDCPISPHTLRRRMKALGLRCKRPRYFYEEKAPHRAQKKGQ